MLLASRKVQSYYSIRLRHLLSRNMRSACSIHSLVKYAPTTKLQKSTDLKKVDPLNSTGPKISKKVNPRGANKDRFAAPLWRGWVDVFVLMFGPVLLNGSTFLQIGRLSQIGSSAGQVIKMRERAGAVRRRWESSWRGVSGGRRPDSKDVLFCVFRLLRAIAHGSCLQHAVAV